MNKILNVQKKIDNHLVDLVVYARKFFILNPLLGYFYITKTVMYDTE